MSVVMFAGSGFSVFAQKPENKKNTAELLQEWTAPLSAKYKYRPFYYDREITKKDLEDRTLYELTLMRNTIFARAGNPFRKKWLNDYFSAQNWYKPLAKTDESKITALDRKNAETITKFESSLDKERLATEQNRMLSAIQEDPNPPATLQQKIDLHLLASRLGNWDRIKSGKIKLGEEQMTALEDPELLDKLLTVEELMDFSRRDLRLLRNMVYARRGRPFHSELLKDYFSATEWYHSDTKYSDAKLTDIDKRNINIILSVESSLGGPLTDYLHKIVDGWFTES